MSKPNRKAEKPGVLARFVEGETGSVAMMFALTIFVFMGAAGSAIDYARFSRVKQVYVTAVDNAALAAARAKQLGASDEVAIAAAESYMQPVKAANPVDGPVTFTVVDGGTAVEGRAQLAMPTIVMSIFKIVKMNFEISNKTQFSHGGDVELAMMLDVTGSMNGAKIADLKTAVEGLIEIVVREDGSNSRIALAPFSNAVKLKTKQFRAATGRDNSGGGSYKGCVVERSGSSAYNDDAPGSGRFLTPLEDVVPGAPCKDGSEVFPLSRKKSDLKAMVRSLTAGGMTAGHLGTAWAWYLLSPNWSDLFDSSEEPAPYAKLREVDEKGKPKLRKIAVLMTDGEYNMAYLNADSTTQARAICEEMKTTGIEVFTVGFEVGESGTVVETLKKCASAPSNFYNATDGTALIKAFRDIALKASPLRISQ